MIRRISEISSIGNFYDCKNGGQCQFEKLTLIYGLNTYGKSTLVDILNSLSTNDPQRILNRKSIGDVTNVNPRVVLNIHDKEVKEKAIIFNNSSWQGFNNDYQIEVFDNKYIQSNVFTGLDITRENKLNITEFILGSENVSLAKQISDLKKQKRDYGTDIRTIAGSISKVLPQGVDLEKFIELKVRDNISEILKNKNKAKDVLENKNKNSQRILDIKEADPIIVDTSIISEFKKANELLEKTYEDINNYALDRIRQHLHNNFLKSDSNSELWIKDGILKYYKSDVGQSYCPFCGQAISNCEDLIDIYKRYFSEAYQIFSENIIESLRVIYKDIKNRIMNINNSILKDNLIRLKGCFEFIQDVEFKDYVNSLEIASTILYEFVDAYIIELGNLLEQLEMKAKQKKEMPYEKKSTINLDDIDNITIDINLKLVSVNEIIHKINEYIEKTKKSIQNDEVTKQLKGMQNTISGLELEQLREKFKELCNAYLLKERDQKEVSTEITKKQEELKKKMNDFLNLYFDRINKYLQLFGTRNFQIERKIATNGDMPVISLCVKFKGHEISEKNLKNILSESDIRALALSVFWTKIYTEESLPKMIVVLDDPITSFDSNRIRAAVSEIFNLSGKCAQVIALSHYENFVTTLLGCYNGNCELKVIKINKNNKTSYLENGDFNEFLLDEHDKKLEKIERFISGETNEDISKDLRVYFENEFKRRYRYQILKLDIENLMMKDLILKLSEAHIISDSIKEKVLDFLRILNPEHHKYIPSNPEEWRIIALDVLNFIFGVLTVTQNQASNIA